MVIAHTSNLVSQNNSYLIDLYEFEDECEDLFSFLQFKGLHWAYGKTLEDLKNDVGLIQSMLDELTSDINEKLFFPSKIINELEILNTVPG